MNDLNNNDNCYIKINNDYEYYANLNLWESLQFKDIHNLKKALSNKYIKINKTDYYGRTCFHKFLNEIKKVTLIELRIILIILNNEPDLDIKDDYNLSARDKLLELGYIVDRKYLKIK